MLSDAVIRTAKPRDRAYRISDRDGLYLQVQPGGSKLWRLRYFWQGRERMLSLGRYPEVSLKEARARRDEARRLLAQGIDPSAARRAERQGPVYTFAAVAMEWVQLHTPTWAPTHADQVRRRLETDVLPWIGSLGVDALTAPEILTIARRIEARGAPVTARRVIQIIGQVIRYAIATGRATIDPTPSLRGALMPARGGHFAAPTTPEALADILRAIHAYEGSLLVRTALQLLPMLFPRPGELRGMRWADIRLEGDDAMWSFVVSKTRQDHIVPLPRQAVALLQEIQPLTGGGVYVFPGVKEFTRPMSEMTLTMALRRMGYNTSKEVTPHGFRATARTLLHEVLGFPPDVIELQLAHRVPDRLGRAYNRTRFLDQRRVMMQAWADYLEDLRLNYPAKAGA